MVAVGEEEGRFWNAWSDECACRGTVVNVIVNLHTKLSQPGMLMKGGGEVSVSSSGSTLIRIMFSVSLPP